MSQIFSYLQSKPSATKMSSSYGCAEDYMRSSGFQSTLTLGSIQKCHFFSLVLLFIFLNSSAFLCLSGY